MATYTVIILASTEGSPTDLELSDVCLHLADCLDSPVVERVDGSYGPADYTFDAWSLEMFEETGERVWLYTRNATDPRFADETQQTPPTGLRQGWVRRLLDRLR